MMKLRDVAVALLLAMVLAVAELILGDYGHE